MADSWLKLPSSCEDRSPSGAFAKEIDASVEKLRREKAISSEERHAARNIDLSISKGDLHISEKKLEKLRILCQLWDLKLSPREISSHRKFIGPIIVTVKKKLFPIFQFFLKDLIRQQRDFNATTIRLMAEICQEESKSESQAKRG